jgi:hypothetical protein
MEIQPNMNPGESDSSEIPMPVDSELEELTLFDMIHFSELENPLVLDDDFFQIARPYLRPRTTDLPIQKSLAKHFCLENSKKTESLPVLRFFANTNFFSLS